MRSLDRGDFPARFPEQQYPLLISALLSVPRLEYLEPPLMENRPIPLLYDLSKVSGICRTLPMYPRFPPFAILHTLHLKYKRIPSVDAVVWGFRRMMQDLEQQVPLWNENILEIPHSAVKSAKHEISGICSCIAQRLRGRPSEVSSGMVDNFHLDALVVNVPAEALSL
jgi:hypothetical protein